MRRDDLMKPDLVSEVVLLTTGILIVATLILIVVGALMQIVLLP
jgi:hypothetical protein